MEGFFSKSETVSRSRSNGKTYSCISCGLYKNCKTQKIAPIGKNKKGIINILPYPDRSEDRTEAYNGRVATYLSELYSSVGIDIYEDCLNIYAINCYTEQEPTDFQIQSCHKIVTNILEKQNNIKVIVLFGKIPLVSIIGSRWKKDLGELNKWIGWCIPDQELKAWIIPTFNIIDVIESKTQVERLLLLKDLDKVVRHSKKELYQYIEPQIEYITDLNELNSIESKYVAFDYETTGKKPYAKGHKIVCASIAVDENKVYSFLMPQNKREQLPFRKFLRNKTIGKIAQNMKFEHIWSQIILNTEVRGWAWDTMIATHIMDNRARITGLKFQVYVNFGIIDYDSEISNFLKSDDDKDSNAFNKIRELLRTDKGTKSLLKYCAMDSIFEYRLALLQQKILNYKLPKNSPFLNQPVYDAYQLFHKGILALARAEMNGLRIDDAYTQKTKLKLTKQIEKLEVDFLNTEFAKKWQKHSKSKINLNSNLMLANFLYDVMNITPVKFTPKGTPSTDEEALQLLKIPELDLLLQRSKLLKIRDTYLESFARESIDGYMHPIFNLHLVATYRSSSDSPNFQNIPKRDKEAMQLVRKAIYPRPGHQLMELDFKGIEVAIAACYHKDPTMITYITDPTADMHGDMAKQIFVIDNFNKKQVDHAYLRSAAKNSFVFPQFYGDYYKNNANDICSHWVQLPQSKWNKNVGYMLSNGKTLGEHLLSIGIKSYQHFENHLKEIEADFWTNRFPAYKRWKDTAWAQYLKKGFVTYYTGFVVQGVMNKKEVINYPIQGSAFHVLLWLFIEIDLILQEYDTLLVGQIHDAVILDVNPTELSEIHKKVIDLVTIALPKRFPWIIVPLEIEAELCPVDASWADKKEWNP